MAAGTLWATMAYIWCGAVALSCWAPSLVLKVNIRLLIAIQEVLWIGASMLRLPLDGFLKKL